MNLLAGSWSVELAAAHLALRRHRHGEMEFGGGESERVSAMQRYRLANRKDAGNFGRTQLLDNIRSVKRPAWFLLVTVARRVFGNANGCRIGNRGVPHESVSGNSLTHTLWKYRRVSMPTAESASNRPDTASPSEHNTRICSSSSPLYWKQRC